MKEQEFKQISNALKVHIATAIDKLADDIGDLIILQVAETINPNHNDYASYVEMLAQEAMDYVLHEVTGGNHEV